MSLLRLRIGYKNGLGVDEAHYVLYGRHLDLSYFDHPPLTGWVHFIFQSLLPAGDYVARVPAILLSLLTSILLAQFLERRGFQPRTVALAIVALNLTPLFNALSLMLLPDTLLLPLTFMIIAFAEEITNDNSRLRPTISWLGLGVSLGLAGLTKYTAILFLPPLIFYFLQKKRWQKIFSFSFLLGFVVACLVVSPVLIWNIRNHFISFSYQSGHVLNFSDLKFANFAQSWLGQVILWGVGLGGLAFWPFFRRQRGGSWTSDLGSLVALTGLLFFIAVSFSQVLLPHWPAYFFILMLPLAVALLWEHGHKKMILGAVFLSGAITLPLLAELAFQILPGSMTALLYRDVRQWGPVMGDAAQILREVPGPQKGLAVFNWTLGSRALYYSPQEEMVFVLDGKNHQFEFWNPVSPRGYNLVIAIEDEKIEETLSQMSCESVEKVGHRKGLEKGAVIHSFSYYRCLNYLGLKSQ